MGGEGTAAEEFAAELALQVCADFHERYEFLNDGPISSGGQGEVFRVRDRRLRRVVALKRLPADASNSKPRLFRFVAEAQIASQLDHPGFLPIFDLGLDPDGRAFYTTALLSGRTLENVIGEVHGDRSGPRLELRRVLELLIQLCNILAHAHSRGVFHRDLKPKNILIGDYGEVFVIDLGSAGVARSAVTAIELESIDTDREASLRCDPLSPLATEASGVPRTWLFTPPDELIEAPRVPNPGADIYALGVILYQLLAGRLPYAGPDGALLEPDALYRMILKGPPEPVRSINPKLHRDLAAICETAMAPPEKRYRTVRELAEDLRAFMEVRPVRARKPDLWITLGRWTQRHARVLFLVWLVTTIIAFAVIVVHNQQAEKNQARQTAALRDAQLAARNGQWLQVIAHLHRAEQAGYKDQVHLALERLQAWRVLSDYRKVQAELRLLTNHTDLGQYAPIVSFEQGIEQLYVGGNTAEGLRLIKQALAQGLDPASEALARGLLAQSTPEALEHFQRAIRLNPFHRVAHEYALSTEFLLGRREEFETHLKLFRGLFPDDPIAALVEGLVLALDGHVEEAMERIDPVRPSFSPAKWRQFSSIIRFFGNVAPELEIEAVLSPKKARDPRLEALISDVITMALGSMASASTTNEPGLRLPHFPHLDGVFELACQSLLAFGVSSAKKTLFGFALPSAKVDIDRLVGQIRRISQRHPEGLLPLVAATLLTSKPAATPPEQRELTRAAADLYQTAADAPSFIRQGTRYARYGAAHLQFELAQEPPPIGPEAREACLKNLRILAEPTTTGAAQLHHYFRMAFSLRDFDLCRELLARWEKVEPGDPEVLKARLQVEMTTGAYESARELLDRFLKENPTNSWALGKKQELAIAVRRLADTLTTSTSPAASP